MVIKQFGRLFSANWPVKPVICPGAQGFVKLTMTTLDVLRANLMGELEWLAADGKQATFEVPTYGIRTG